MPPALPPPLADRHAGGPEAECGSGPAKRVGGCSGQAGSRVHARPCVSSEHAGSGVAAGRCVRMCVGVCKCAHGWVRAYWAKGARTAPHVIRARRVWCRSWKVCLRICVCARMGVFVCRCTCVYMCSHGFMFACTCV